MLPDASQTTRLRGVEARHTLEVGRCVALLVIGGPRLSRARWR